MADRTGRGASGWRPWTAALVCLLVVISLAAPELRADEDGRVLKAQLLVLDGADVELWEIAG
jgi:hypothetical protein